MEQLYSCCTAALSSQYFLQPLHSSKAAAVQRLSLRNAGYCHDAATILYCDSQIERLYSDSNLGHICLITLC